MEKALNIAASGSDSKPNGKSRTCDIASLHGVRFAPSPTGLFHVGNLRTAWISRELARAWSQPWVVRFEDIDGPRVLAGSQEAQLADMATLGLRPDELVVQSLAHGRHWQVFERAVAERRVYPCFCSRKDVREALEGAGSAPHPVTAARPATAAQSHEVNRTDDVSAASGAAVQPLPNNIYSGHCRKLLAQPSSGAWPSPASHGLPSLAWRFALEEDPSGHSDFIVARTSPVLPADSSTFAPAYHLACAIDDLDGNHHTLVRAADLAEVIPQHQAIMRWLAVAEGQRFSPVAVFHTSLVTQNDGHRLEKRTQGVTLAELKVAGWTPERLITQFQKSWDSNLAYAWAPGNIFGEARATLTLKDLGL